MEPDATKRAQLLAAANPDLRAQVKLVEDLAKDGDGFKIEGNKIIPLDLNGDGKVLGVQVPVAAPGQPAAAIDLEKLQYGVRANAIVAAADKKAAATAAYTDGLFAGKSQADIAKNILAATPDAHKVAVAAALQSAAAAGQQVAVAGAAGLGLGVLLGTNAQRAAFVLAGVVGDRANLLTRANLPATAADRAQFANAAGSDADALALVALLALANDDDKADFIVALAGLQPPAARLQAVAQALVAGGRDVFVRDQGARLGVRSEGLLMHLLGVRPAPFIQPPAQAPAANPAPIAPAPANVQPAAPIIIQAAPANPPANVQPAPVNPAPNAAQQAAAILGGQAPALIAPPAANAAPVAQALPAAAPADRELELERLRLEQALAQLERDRMALEQQRLAFEQQRAAIELEKLQLERLRLAQPAPAAPVAQAPTAEPVPLIPAVALPPAEPAPEDSSALATLSTEVAPSYPQTGPHKGLADATP
jgi:hypothetical protein